MILDGSVDPFQVWQDAERYLTLGARTYSPFCNIMDVAKRHRPQDGDRTFELESFWLSYDIGSYIANGVHSELHDLYRHADRFLFVVHPDVLAMPGLHLGSLLEGTLRGPAVEVAPSANVRTVFVTRIDGKAVASHFLKLHYPRRISRFFRPLPLEDIEVQLWSTRQLANVGLAVFPDVGGGVLGSAPSEAWGYIVREATPANGRGLRYAVPLFALYSRDIRSPSDPILLAQLSQTGHAPALIETIVRGMIQMWITAVSKAGCLIEPHSQNTLFMFSGADDSWQVAYRDVGIYADPPICLNGGAVSGRPPIDEIGRDVQIPREQLLSLTYDTFLGHHALAYLSRSVCATFGIKSSFMPNLAKSIFSELGGHELGLPATTFAFDDKLYLNEEFRLLDTEQPPIWR